MTAAARSADGFEQLRVLAERCHTECDSYDAATDLVMAEIYRVVGRDLPPLADAACRTGARSAVHEAAKKDRNVAKRPWLKPVVAAEKPTQSGNRSRSAAQSQQASSAVIQEATKVRKIPAWDRSMAGLENVGKIIRESILDTWEIGMKKIGDMTGAEILQHAASSRRQAHGHMQAAKFFEELGHQTPADGVVRKYVTGSKADQIWNTIREEAA